MFGLKSKKEKLEAKLTKLLKEAYELSHTNRAKSDEKTAEADQLQRQIDAMEPPRSVDAAIARTLTFEEQLFAETRWSDAFSSGGDQKTWGGVRLGSRLVDSRTREVELTAAEAFAAIRRIGGETGWYYGNWLWQIRGFMDLLVGGVGVRRGRRHPDQLRVGDTVDFWRVEQIIDDKVLRLSAEMKVPGRAWLEFEVNEQDGVTTVHQTAIFDPAGLFGILYWYSLFPLHEFVFRGMLRNICKAAELSALPDQT